MKRANWLVGSVAVGIAVAAGCADDDRPIAPLEPEAGETNQGGSSAGSAGKGGTSNTGGSNGGSQSGGKGGTGSAGKGGAGGSASAGEAGASSGGAGGEAISIDPGGAPAGGADGAAGAGGDSTAAGPAPFAGPYAVVFAGPSIGVDFRPAKSATFVDGALVDFVSSINEHRALGTASSFNADKTEFVQWGRWADGTMGVTDQVALSATQGFDYAIGAISPALPANGTQDYEIVGYPPVVVGDGSKPLGTLTASATAAFSATTHVGATFSLDIGGVTYTVTTAGGTATPGTSEVTASSPTYPGFVAGIPADPNTGICADGCTVSVMGYFAGPNVENLAFVVHIYDTFGGSPTSVSGVVVLKKKA